MKKDELLKGNPLAQYVELMRLENDFLKDVGLVEAFNGKPLNKGMAATYGQARATVEGNLGAIRRSLRSQTIGWFYFPAKTATTGSPLDRMRPVSAVDYIVRQADKHPYVMIGEEHMKPQTRTILLPLLRRLYAKGFRYFAAETFYQAIKSAPVRGYPAWDDGYYIQDPVYAEAVREAIKLGYKLVPYEAEEQPKDAPKDDPWFNQNFREHLQADNLKTRIFDHDPKAKVLVWAGRSHVVKVASKQDGGEFRPMAYEFKRMTGIDPLSVYLPTDVEAAAPEYEREDYKYAADKGWIHGPTIFVGAHGGAYGLDENEATVFFPRTTYVHGRPDWLARNLGRVPRDIPASMVSRPGYLLAQAWKEGEPVQAIPIDQILITPGDPVPVLMLPRGGSFWMRVIDPTGKVLGTSRLHT
ncbi:hypothetical protein OP10G_0316 [Fimbriimonas ginsengisoli Gsoil 348]|uniref:Uncharacterized protein n=1 Tax=Fimbriimonas ginsengisoli Gsoil 348 TaxID=661478 RepID=A0A068NQ10_FIMGI|nr:hypothetical protein OP10G_0316 [Fimbriimonas ginsengisoli Gsoil 348]